MEFKVGDKVKIPTQSTANIGDYKRACDELVGYELDYLVITDLNTHENPSWEVGLDMDSGKTLFSNAFNFIDIELYEEEFPEKWCLEITKESFPFIQRLHKDFEDFKNHTQFSNRYLRSDHSYGHRSIKEPSEEYPEITLDQFKKHILKESTTMKNLLETGFVIENCTLSQRAAIKHYCDEKKIEYTDNLFTTINYSHLCCLFKKEKARFTGHVSNKLLDGKVLESITFSELIQFLDQYQPEPEFKIGDTVVFTGKNDGIVTDCWNIGKVGVISKISNGYFHFDNVDNFNCFSTGNGSNREKSFRHATSEEIKKWKKENEIKLPKIDGNEGVVEIVVNPHSASDVNLKWGCTTISISTVKELIKVGVNHITLKNLHVVESEIQQIKKFIEHNKL